MSDKKFYLVHPLDVLFFRDNKPFDKGTWYSEGMFPPLPSTFQGLIRTTILAKNKFIGDDGKLKDKEAAKKLVGDDVEFPFDIQGPFVSDGETLFFSTPKDIVLNGDRICSQNKIKQSNVTNDLGIKLNYADKVKQKFVYFDRTGICQENMIQYCKTREFNNLKTYPCEDENHIGIELEKDKSTKEHHFYMTKYNRMHENAGLFFSITSTNGTNVADLDGLHGKLGSESRGVAIRKTDDLLQINEQDDDFYNDLVEDGIFKIILLTPGIFDHGWLPFEHKNGKITINHNSKSFEIELYYAVNDIPLKISGYSQRKHKDNKRGYGVKKQVKGVPAGSVYYFKINLKDQDKPLVSDWLKSIDNKKIGQNIYSCMGYNHILLGKIK